MVTDGTPNRTPLNYFMLCDRLMHRCTPGLNQRNETDHKGCSRATMFIQQVLRPPRQLCHNIILYCILHLTLAVLAYKYLKRLESYSFHQTLGIELSRAMHRTEYSAQHTQVQGCGSQWVAMQSKGHTMGSQPV